MRYKRPQEPEQWNDANYTLYKKFEFTNSVEYEWLMDLVKENIPDRGNDSYTRAELLGVLRSQWILACIKDTLRHLHPKTYKIRFTLKLIARWYNRTFNTKKYKEQVYLCNIASKVGDEMVKND